MKKIITIIAVMLSVMTAIAQQKDITKFLGIPVDGTVQTMRQKLIAKGFKPTANSNVLTGEFNGNDVIIMIATNNNKVRRLMITDYDGTRNITNIRIKFNNLVRQFKRNTKYYDSNMDQTIPEDEDISYQMIVKNKRYEALFFQKPYTYTIEDTDPEDISKRLVWFYIFRDDYGEYFIVMFYENGYNMANGEDL